MCRGVKNIEASSLPDLAMRVQSSSESSARNSSYLSGKLLKTDRRSVGKGKIDPVRLQSEYEQIVVGA
jgi:hypothetical protein